MDPEELKVPPCPRELLHFILPLFRRLGDTRRFADGVPLPITDSEILAWQTLEGVRVGPEDAELVRALDRIWLTAVRTS